MTESIVLYKLVDAITPVDVNQEALIVHKR